MVRVGGMKNLIPALLIAAALAACGKSDTSKTQTTGNPAVAPLAPSAAPEAAAIAGPVVAGFDPAKTPIANATLGAWPYFGLIDGYTRMTKANSAGDAGTVDYLKEANFDRYEFYDGVKLIPVEGRLVSFKAKGKDAAFFEVQKTYERLVKDLGGVTVFEGKGQSLTDNKLKFSDGRHRARYWLEKDEMGVYMVRLPDREIWVEAYHPYPVDNNDYWLTVVEKKTLDPRAKLLGAEEMKTALDTAGHIALYINFDTDKTSIKPDAAPAIAEIVKLMNSNPGLKITVEGHTDNVGAPARNQTLSEGRAAAVVGSLMAQGVAMDRMTPKGFGQTKPIADNGTEDGRAKNRRVELVKR